jgi:hypothetical protein
MCGQVERPAKESDKVYPKNQQYERVYDWEHVEVIPAARAASAWRSTTAGSWLSYAPYAG